MLTFYQTLTSGIDAINVLIIYTPLFCVHLVTHTVLYLDNTHFIRLS